jgi:hypothetical protein
MTTALRASPYPGRDSGGEQAGGWICTYTGHWIDPLDPDPSDVRIEDIAHSLANQCRFTGHVSEFYSTAQHSYLVSAIVPREDALWGLLHDASEAYLSDIAAPVKRQPGFGDVYKAAELRLEEAIATHFDLPWPMPDTIKPADRAVLRAEQRDLMPNEPSEGDILPHPVIPWDPKFARAMFIERYNSLTGQSIKFPKPPERTLWDVKREQRRKD